MQMEQAPGASPAPAEVQLARYLQAYQQQQLHSAAQQPLTHSWPAPLQQRRQQPDHQHCLDLSSQQHQYGKGHLEPGYPHLERQPPPDGRNGLSSAAFRSYLTAPFRGSGYGHVEDSGAPGQGGMEMDSGPDGGAAAAAYRGLPLGANSRSNPPPFHPAMVAGMLEAAGSQRHIPGQLQPPGLLDHEPGQQPTRMSQRSSARAYVPKVRRARHELCGPCSNCHSITSPQWRKGPPGKPVLCNACGIRFHRTKSLHIPPPRGLSMKRKVVVTVGGRPPWLLYPHDSPAYSEAYSEGMLWEEYDYAYEEDMAALHYGARRMHPAPGQYPYDASTDEEGSGGASSQRLPTVTARALEALVLAGIPLQEAAARLGVGLPVPVAPRRRPFQPPAEGEWEAEVDEPASNSMDLLAAAAADALACDGELRQPAGPPAAPPADASAGPPARPARAVLARAVKGGRGVVPSAPPPPRGPLSTPDYMAAVMALKDRTGSIDAAVDLLLGRPAVSGDGSEGASGGGKTYVVVRTRSKGPSRLGRGGEGEATSGVLQAD